MHQPEKTAGYLLTTTLAGFGIERFASSHWMKIIAPSTLMGVFAVIKIALVTCGVVWPRPAQDEQRLSLKRRLCAHSMRRGVEIRCALPTPPPPRSPAKIHPTNAVL